MNTPSFLESHVSQIPAIQLLQQMGYSYLNAETVAVERKGKLNHVLLEGILTSQLKRINRVRAKGKEIPFSDDAIRKAVDALQKIPYDGLCRTSEKIYDLLMLGMSIDQTVDGETKGRSLAFIDWEHPRNNVFHVAAEFKVERTASHETRRPDIVCFVNGIPFVIIECKRRDEKDSLSAAIKQHLRNQEEDQIPSLYIFAMLTLSLNKEGGRYATTGTAEKFWAEWREMFSADAEVRKLVNSPPKRDEHEALFTGEFAYARDYFEDLATEGGREITDQDRLLYSLCKPERLIEVSRQYILFDEGGTVKKVARYQQYFAVKKTMDRIRLTDAQGKRQGGVIWHTQGSGKSLTMVMLGKALALESGIANPRVVLVTDRIDLDEQIWKTFHLCGKEPQQAKTGKHLGELLMDERIPVITTVLDKFGTAGRASDGFFNPDANIFVLVDESHRSQYGEANLRMMKALPNACYIGFTGTPLMKKEKNTARKFGGIIDPAYTIRNAVEDQAVVPLLYEGRHVLQDINQKAVDRMFDAMSDGLSSDQKADLKRKFASRDELNRLESRLYLVAWDVSQHFDKNWKGSGFKGQLTAPNKKSALIIKRFLDQFGKISSEVLISAPDDREGEGADEDDDNIQKFWKQMMTKHGTEKEYNRNVITAFKGDCEPDIIIVVDKLLTGFDAPRNVVLYIARSLKEHTLLQAIARVNRLHPGKDFGYIMDYYGVIGNLHEALELYSALAGELFDPEDLESALTDVAEELKQLPSAHDAVWDMFRSVSNKKDDEAFVLELVEADIREEFYSRLSKFCRLLKVGLSTLSWVNASDPKKVERYKKDAAFFQKLRSSVKIRYAEEIDYRDYEKQIQKMLNTYVQADEVIQVVDPVNIFEREAFQKEVDKATSPRAKADTIINRTKKTITEKIEEDPFLYRKFSAILQEVIDDYKSARINEIEYLQRAQELLEKVREGRREDTPELVAHSDLAKAFYGAVKINLINDDRSSELVAEEEAAEYRLGKTSNSLTPDMAKSLGTLACDIETIIRKHAVVRWRENTDAQNRMRNELDDLLFELKGNSDTDLDLDKIDTIIESIIQIARSRNDV